MFGFGKSIKDPLADAKTAERWLPTFPANDRWRSTRPSWPSSARCTERDANRTPARLEAVFRLDRRSEALRRTLTAQYLEHGSRSSRVESQLWQALFDLTQGFLLCYQAFAREVERSRAKQPVACAAAGADRAPDHPPRPRRQESACIATSSGFRPSWADLHSLFQSRARRRSSGSRWRRWPTAH